ncbi:hypothetical protein M441DRAFT_306206 [Trichoderma asperellum CBS 433.97]|uniref:Uncharacterized protein n=1 Tax=Trichoderma asperellum (strain ATCC 204424 / CBS 433.97 / NBRC 101777) TaxID=1042311 RepID=A0A2T3ZJZ4_TRIA4|nr:hypothetical protein M441DRAFT_306206 [Trichoderma asperellum CBS 433.97]PTB45093.1 hypothetical protein M441DRAFT_306206 [Trichoderma asperellum CBS 433.97]WVH32632.1 hypothetical protein [Trichoderma asperellum]
MFKWTISAIPLHYLLFFFFFFLHWYRITNVRFAVRWISRMQLCNNSDQRGEGSVARFPFLFFFQVIAQRRLES